MKHGYENGKSDELIRNYKTSDNNIIITFLDGSKFEVPFTKEEENKILKQMLDQAKKRSESSALDDATYERKKAIRQTFTQIGCTIINVFSSNIYDGTSIGSFSRILGGITCIFVVLHGADWKLKTDEIKELEKYDIYLSIKEELENTIIPNMFSKVKTKNRTLNINTLDNYSLNDIKKIRQNLEVYKTYQAYPESQSNKQLLKR